MNLQSVYVSWVDLFAFIILLVGLRRGQKRGLSQEILFLLQWMVIVVAGGFFYAPLGELLRQNSVFSTLFCYLAAYTLVALLVKLGFNCVRKSVGEKLVQNDVFGGGEYYLGMVAGACRYACILVVAFSVLNSRQFTRQELAAKSTYQKVNFGSVFFPSISDVQAEVFERSWSGRFTQTYLSTVLIRPTSGEGRSLTRGAVVKARERVIDEVLEKK